MTANHYTDDPTVHTTYFDGRWIPTGRTLTTVDVDAINKRMASQVERINSRRALSDEAKRIEIARVYREARDAIQAAGQNVVQQVNSERNRLSRKLFGHEGVADPQTVAIRRDAADRAAKLDSPEAAQRAMEIAEMNGDVYMAQAIAGTANANMWTDVVHSYLDAHPEAGDAAQQLRELPDTADPVWQLQHAMTYSVAQPSELGGIPDYQVDRLADTVLDGGDAAA
ncbi:hypothetical protein [Streptomyces lavendulocolor]|uniref:hypothetical protein n=1 Tax=Streptomyces lavendulocolor TaxID=67316 RepID=UPI0033F257FD